MAIVGTLAISAAPALSRMQSARHAALAGEIERRIAFVQAEAVASGGPAGIRFDLDTQRTDKRILDNSGAATNAEPVLGAERWAMPVSASLPGTALVEINIPGGDGETLWFDYLGRPELRNADGSSPTPLDSNARVGLSGGHAVTIRPVTGFVERDS
jgi:hypothetical protein